MEFTLEQIADLIGGDVEGNKQQKIHSIDKIEEGVEGSIAFLSNPKYEQFIYETGASAVIVKRDFQPTKAISSNLVRVEDPYSAFTRLLEEYNKMRVAAREGIEEPVHISGSARLGEGVFVGAFSHIGENVRIGKEVKIYPQCYIGDNVEIGDNTLIYPGVKIHYDSVIGRHCVLHAGAVIGSDGFGFAPQDDGTYKSIPQVGNVVLEDGVNIGANTVVDRATLGSTRIRKGVKLDNLIQIAHNVEIGENTVMAAQSGISGSTKLGKGCVLAGQVGVVGHIEIADNVTLAAKTGLSRSVKEAGSVKLGVPALDHKAFLRCHAVYRNLPELNNRVRQLEEKVVNLRPE